MLLYHFNNIEHNTKQNIYTGMEVGGNLNLYIKTAGMTIY